MLGGYEDLSNIFSADTMGSWILPALYLIFKLSKSYMSHEDNTWFKNQNLMVEFYTLVALKHGVCLCKFMIILAIPPRPGTEAPRVRFPLFDPQESLEGSCQSRSQHLSVESLRFCSLLGTSHIFQTQTGFGSFLHLKRVKEGTYCT